MSKSPIFLVILLFVIPLNAIGQVDSSLTIEKIMQDPKWIGTSPSSIRWSENSENIYFNWNPENFRSDSLYKIGLNNLAPLQVSNEERRLLPSRSGSYNKDRSIKVFAKNGDLYLLDIATNELKQLTNSINSESSPKFLGEDHLIAYHHENNIFRWDLKNNTVTQITNFKKGKAPKTEKKQLPRNESWLQEDQLATFDVLNKRKTDREARKKMQNTNQVKRPKAIYYGNKSISSMTISPNQNFVTYRLVTSAKQVKTTNVPDYVTASGFTKELRARPKVGTNQSFHEFFIYNVEKDSSYQVDIKEIPGIYDKPKFQQSKKNKKEFSSTPRQVVVLGPIWSENAENAVVVVRALDNKDRWIMTLDPQTGKLKLLDRQHSDAWIGGPGVSSWNFSMGSIGWMADNETIWFQSEENGYAHLYTFNINTNKRKALTKGKFEIYNPFLSKDKQHFYFSANEVHPGERHFYKLTVADGKKEKLTTMPGRNDVTLSPDEKKMAIRHSFANQPWELYLVDMVGDKEVKKITDSQTEDFRSYTWRTPEFVTFKANDGAQVNARLYKPIKPNSNGPAVIFVHGAGYLQNAHKWWSSYFREYMFHNFLVDKGYTVLDIDYRGSAGYGADWRTGIYRFMGGKDLDDQVDGAAYLVKQHGIDPDRIGIYGGSYGGFITLMAMFTKPGVFKAGAALRSVTDWAHYNHPYTANILNTPVEDSIAYAKSSPIYYAEGLQDALLICHGMVDTNVHFQDVVRLAQRLIELGKENWEFAVYPVENHGFVEPSSWTDEYKRIFNLFERELKP